MARGVQLQPYTPRSYTPEDLRWAQIRELEAELEFSEANCPDVCRDQIRKELDNLRLKPKK